MTEEGALEGYRAEVRAWLAANIPPGDRTPSGEEARAFQRRLFDAGYAGISWPIEYGGQGLSALEAQIFTEEGARYTMPNGPLGIGFAMVGPSILDLGTEDQRQRFIPPMLRGEEAWCQLFSEPGAGSDLAALSTKATRDGDDWIITGHKVWTSSAHIADFGWLLARTDPEVPKHEGMTMFIIDLKAPGVTVRPLRDMTGQAPFNEVFLDAVRVPDANRVGEPGTGWQVATKTLTHERLSQSGTRQNRSRGITFVSLAELARQRGRLDDAAVRETLVDVYMAERALDLFNIRLRQEFKAGVDVGSRGSVGKFAGALQLIRAEAMVSDIVGFEAAAFEEESPVDEALELGINSASASSLAGGTNEIQKSIIGERILGLPREPAADRGIPFNQLRVGGA